MAKHTKRALLPPKHDRPLPDVEPTETPVVTAYDDVCFLTCSDESVHKVLFKALRFREPNCFHDILFKRRLWDGFTNFYNWKEGFKTGKFGTGLLPQIQLGLSRLQRPATICDLRKPLESLDPSAANDDALTSMGFLLDRAWYQVPAAQAALSEKRGVITVATGGGKTAIMCMILRELEKKRVPTVVTTKGKLIKQLHHEARLRGIECGLVSGDTIEPSYITFVNVESVHKIGPMLSHIRFLIADEVHLMANDQGISLFERMPVCAGRIGFSASPWKRKNEGRTHNYRIKSWFGPELIDVSIDELITADILAKARAVFHLIDSPRIDSGDYKTDYSTCVIENRAVTEKIVSICGSSVGRKLVCVDSIDHGHNLTAALSTAGENAHFIWGDTEDEVREDMYELLRTHAGNITVVGSKMLQTGIDVWVHVLINARGMKAELSTQQLFGRGTRKAADKDTVTYHDFYYSQDVSQYLNRHSKARINQLKSMKIPVEFDNFDPSCY